VKIPLVSVAVAAFNGERFIGEQLDSILAQDWPSIEVVVSDDASTDGTVGVVEEYARRAPVRLLPNGTRAGVSANFARAIAACRGEYIALADQDDIWKPGRLTRLVDAIGDSSLVYCKTTEVLDATGSVRREHAFDSYHSFARQYGSGRLTRFLLSENWVVSHTMMFKRPVIERALPFPDGLSFHDGWLALVASTQGGLKFLDESWQVYREHENSVTYAGAHARRKRAALAWRLLGDDFARSWRARCKENMVIVEEALRRSELTADERWHAQQMRTYLESGLGRGRARDWWRAGRAVAPYFASAIIQGTRWKVPWRALLGGIMVRSVDRRRLRSF